MQTTIAQKPGSVAWAAFRQPSGWRFCRPRRSWHRLRPHRSGRMRASRALGQCDAPRSFARFWTMATGHRLDGRTCDGGAGRHRHQQCRGRGERAGSADSRRLVAPFVQGILEAGLRASRRAAARDPRVLRPVEVRVGEALPAVARRSPEIHFDIDFTDAAIGHQGKALDMANGTFLHELMDSRTFCRQSDVIQMQKNGLALGHLSQRVVIDGDRVLSPGGLRHGTRPCATRCWTPWAIWRWPARRFWRAIPATAPAMR